MKGKKQLATFAHRYYKSVVTHGLDRFASIRIPGSRRQRPTLSHLKHSCSSTTEWSTEFEEFASKQMSEKEILALFEK
ncbi:UNVERIFIED_CONTAM: hypothetical protein FKN15_052521 [Acipenser sinensis]